LSTTTPNNTYCAFFYNYTTPSSSSSPVYFVKHPNTVKHDGIFTTYYFRIGVYSNAEYNFITIPSDAVYLIINTVDGSGVDAGVKLYTTTEKNLDHAVDGLIKEVYGQVGGRVYDGERISLKRPKVVITKMCKTPRCQDIWYQDGYFFNCELRTNKRFELYHYEGGALSLKAYWGLQETVGATFVSSSEGVHANSMQRTNVFYDPSDKFPIFTIGGNMGSESGKMYVMRLYKDGNDTWQLTKLYDVQGEHWGIFALEDGTIAQLYNGIQISNKKITADNIGTINVTDADMIKIYTNPFPDTTMPQGMINYGNLLFLLEGDSHSYDSNHNLTEPGHLMVYDFIYEKCVNDIYLIPLGIVIEPEGVDIDQGVMYIAENGENNNGYLWKLEFD
jgi:hypothetical protein